MVTVYCNEVLLDDMYSNEDIVENPGGKCDGPCSITNMVTH